MNGQRERKSLDMQYTSRFRHEAIHKAPEYKEDSSKCAFEMKDHDGAGDVKIGTWLPLPC